MINYNKLSRSRAVCLPENRSYLLKCEQRRTRWLAFSVACIIMIYLICIEDKF
jgi:hypothetical protein